MFIMRIFVFIIRLTAKNYRAIMYIRIGCINMNKKGFTLIEMITVVFILSVIMTLATYSLARYLKQGRDKSFKVLVNSLEDATLEAYASCVANPTGSNFCLTHDIPSNGQSATINLSELVDENFIEKVKNPWNTSENCSSSSYVKVTRNSSDNISFTYKTCLICGTHKSSGC